MSSVATSRPRSRPPDGHWRRTAPKRRSRPLYDRLYADWDTVEIPASTQQAGNDARRVEVLWTNFTPSLFLPLEAAR